MLRVGGYNIPYPPSRFEEEFLPSVDRVLDVITSHDLLAELDHRGLVPHHPIEAFVAARAGGIAVRGPLVDLVILVGLGVAGDESAPIAPFARAPVMPSRPRSLCSARPMPRPRLP